MPITQRSYYDAAEKGRQDKQAHQINLLRQKATQQDIDQTNILGGFMKDPNTTPEQFTRAGRSDIGNTLLNIQDRPREQQAEQAKQFAQQMTWAAQYGLASASPKALIEKSFPFLVEAYGPDWANATDDEVRAELQGFQARFGVQAGIGPQQPKERPLINTVGPDGKPVRGEDRPGAQVYVAPEKPRSTFRPMSPQEVAASGLPAGTAAQVNDETGQISVLSKRDATSNLSQKDQTTAKLKLNTLRVAKKQLENIKARFEPLRNSLSAGPFGQGSAPTEAGRGFDRAVDQMRSTLTALTRVPGVGAMSDYETKLDQARFPSRGEYEKVTEQQIADLEQMLSLIESGYTDLLGGGSQEAAPVTQPSLDDIRKKYGR